MIKLVVSDIDGTLVQDGTNVLNPELVETIVKLREKGIQFAAASGRQWPSIESTFDAIKDKIFYLSDNGAYMGCCGRQLFTHTIEKELARALLRDIKAAGLVAMVSSPNYVYVEDVDKEFNEWLVKGYQFKIKIVEDVTKVDEEIIKVSAYQNSDIETATVKIREKYEGRLKPTISGHMWMDVMALGVNKGEAVRELQESLGITPEETMVFGDQLNDLEMLRQAYYSYAIGSARQEVKDVARFQADTCANNGVMKILKGLL